VAGCGDRLGIEALLRDHLMDPATTERARPRTRRGRRAYRGGRPNGPTPLRCSHQGRAAKLTSLTTFATFEQLRRVRSRSALTRADLGAALLGASQVAASAPAPRPRGATGAFRRQPRGNALAFRPAAWPVGLSPRGTRRAAQADEGLRIAVRRGVERNCSRSEHRQTPSGVCRACEAEFFARPHSASSAEQSLRSSDRGGRGDRRTDQAARAQVVAWTAG
jgi:hypothetical protein